ncbi:hypothetical protein ALI144C_31025 [Actinosynnema sp. ALI-1.44]|nr:hypothetical protein ALI144C_31025 [Actinosynnema sp. ALI-1.44]
MFPGQGGYAPGALAALAGESRQVLPVLQAVDEVAAEYGHDTISSLLVEESADAADELARSDPARLDLAIFACSVAVHHVLLDSGRTVDVLVGHSLGEIAALTAAGVFTVADGARVVAERAAAFTRRKPPDGGMISLGLDEARTAHLLAALATWRVEIAAVNAPTQTVVSGPTDELTAVEAATVAVGIPSRWLSAPYPFHNAMLEPVAAAFAQAVAGIPVRRPRTRVYSPIALRPYRADTDVLAELVSHLARPVRFAEAVRRLHADGVTAFVECGAGRVLTGLVTRGLSGVDTESPLTSSMPRARSSAQQPAAVPVQRPAAEKPTAPESPDSRTATMPAGDALLETLRQEYADALGYPAEVFVDEADLEADLGVDSLKQVEIFARLRKRFDLPAPPDGRQISAYRTLPAVANGLRELAADTPATR